MRNNLLVQLVYRTVACVVSAFAVLISLGVFYLGKGANGFGWGFLKYYTNLSNYCVFAVSVAVLADTVRRVKNGEREGYNRRWRTFKFMTVVMILVTFLVVPVLLMSPFQAAFWLDVGNMSYHVLAPLLFIFDYLLFDEKGSVSVLAPLYALLPPLVYVGYVMILGAAIPEFVYPYFFLDAATLGYGGVCLWVLGLLAVFTALGYLLWFFNRIVKREGKWKIDLHDPLCRGRKAEKMEEKGEQESSAE